jgi:hypothetical protein
MRTSSNDVATDLKALAFTALLVLAPLTLSPASAPTDVSSKRNADELLLSAYTAREAASVFASGNYELNDHYGNPANFKRYIIRKPPIHA